MNDLDLSNPNGTNGLPPATTEWFKHVRFMVTNPDDTRDFRELTLTPASDADAELLLAAINLLPTLPPPEIGWDNNCAVCGECRGDDLAVTFTEGWRYCRDPLHDGPYCLCPTHFPSHSPRVTEVTIREHPLQDELCLDGGEATPVALG